jgi:4-hydroxybenzoate polyprenyltransferase
MLFFHRPRSVSKLLTGLRTPHLRHRARILCSSREAAIKLQRSLRSSLHGLHRTTYAQPLRYSTTIAPIPTKAINVSETPSPAVYRPPQKGLVSCLPGSWIPYAELIRLDKPTGTYYLFLPCLFSTLLAAPMCQPMATPLEVISTTTLFFTGALIMRGAGCTINDLWDRNLDPYVARTKFRPIARKAITPRKAVIFTGIQLLAGLGILISFPTQCLFYGIPSLLLVASYPLAKRVTNYPQFVLGLTFSWGAMMGFPALGIDLLRDSDALAAAVALYASCVAWTVNYDMIYAHMDIKDDVNAGIKSIALAHEHNTKAVLSGLSVVQIVLLATAGYFAGAGPLFFLGSCGGAAATLATMIYRVRLKEVQNCWWWFKYGCWFTGGSIAAGLFGDYLVKRFSEESEESQHIRPT